jgi:hypothetical protein
VRRRTLTIPAGPHARQLLAEAIAAFAEAAYPPGGSECAQVARETLLTSAETIRQADGPAVVSSRQRSLLKQAVQWYFQEISPHSPPAHSEALLELLHGHSVDDTLFL